MTTYICKLLDRIFGIKDVNTTEYTVEFRIKYIDLGASSGSDVQEYILQKQFVYTPWSDYNNRLTVQEWAPRFNRTILNEHLHTSQFKTIAKQHLISSEWEVLGSKTISVRA